MPKSFGTVSSDSSGAANCSRQKLTTHPSRITAMKKKTDKGNSKTIIFAYQELSKDLHKVGNDMEAWFLRVQTRVSLCPKLSVKTKMSVGCGSLLLHLLDVKSVKEARETAREARARFHVFRDGRKIKRDVDSKKCLLYVSRLSESHAGIINNMTLIVVNFKSKVTKFRQCFRLQNQLQLYKRGRRNAFFCISGLRCELWKCSIKK